MKSRRKTWRETLADRKDWPRVLKLQRRFPCFKTLHKMGVAAGERVVLANPSEVVSCMKKVPQSALVTIVEICRRLAKKHRVRGCCSLTTGIFIMTAAHAAEEAKRKGMDLDIPYWRTLKTDGYLNEKYPGGAESHKALLKQEGHQVVRVEKRWRVDEYQSRLATL